MRLKSYSLGFLVAGLAASAVAMVLSLLTRDAQGCVEWGLAVIILGVAVKALVDKL